MSAPRKTYHAGLSRDRVVLAAVDLLQREGLAGLSLRRLGGELGVDGMSLYSHVRNKDDLLGAAVAHAFRDARPAGKGEWWEQIASVLREHRRVIREHPWVLDIMLSRRVQGSEPWTGAEEALALLTEHLGVAGSARWFRLLVAFTNGFLLTERDAVRPQEEEALAALEQGRPRVADAVRRGMRSADRDFAVGLEALVSAMRAEAAGHAAT